MGKVIFKAGFFLVLVQHCFIRRPSDSTVSEDAGIEPWTVATSALAVRRSNHSANFIHNSTRFHPHSARSHPQFGQISSTFGDISSTSNMWQANHTIA